VNYFENGISRDFADPDANAAAAGGWGAGGLATRQQEMVSKLCELSVICF